MRLEDVPRPEEWGFVPPIDRETVDVLLRGGVCVAARREGTSARTLRRRFAFTGVPLREFLRRERIRRAEGLLMAGRPVADVAEALGFSSRESLAHFLRRELGRTATELRGGSVPLTSWPRKSGARSDEAPHIRVSCR